MSYNVSASEAVSAYAWKGPPESFWHGMQWQAEQDLDNWVLSRIMRVQTQLPLKAAAALGTEDCGFVLGSIIGD